MKNATPHIINSITEYHRLIGLPQPEHPLISIVDLMCSRENEVINLPDFKLIGNFYNIFLKKNVNGAMGYGRKYYDFSNGFMGFASPMQVFIINKELDISNISGWMLLIHPDFIRKYPLMKRIADYGFFSYEMNEALHLSEKEEAVIDRILADIRAEYRQPIDAYSQDVIISHLEVLLNYANRFYNRQFITRRNSEQEPLARFEDLLAEIFNADHINHLPTVNDLAEQLNVSAHYLSDMLRSSTGQNAQQHIHNRLIEKAKEILLTTSLSINEVAFKMGFEYPQYFNRLFKSKTGLTPAAFRKGADSN